MKDIKELIHIVEDWRKVNDHIHQKHHQLAQHYDLTLDQYHLLLKLDRLLRREEAFYPTIGELAQMSNNAQNTMSEKISRLEKIGLVIRVKDEKDRRISRITITDKGKELLQCISNKAKNEFLLNALQRLEEEEIEQFSVILQKLIHNLLASSEEVEV